MEGVEIVFARYDKDRSGDMDVIELGLGTACAQYASGHGRGRPGAQRVRRETVRSGSSCTSFGLSLSDFAPSSNKAIQAKLAAGD